MSVTIGIDIGGTKIAGGLVDDEGTILRRARRETPARSKQGIVDTIVAVVADLVEMAGSAGVDDVEAVGLGAAGL
ncbi:MAG TPA: ROK family protein, partial [Candidatus Nanopelagicales bacterium]